MEKSERIEWLFLKAQSEDLTEEEMGVLANWVQEDPRNLDFINRITEQPIKHDFEILSSYNQDAGWDDLKKSISAPGTAHSRKYQWYFLRIALAAIFIGAVCSLIWIQVWYSKEKSIEANTLFNLDTVSTSNESILILSDGSILKLDSLKPNQSVRQAGVVVTKINTRELNVRNDNNTVNETFNLLKTANVASWKIHLPDGSIAWLNEGSVLRFPVQFKTNRVLHLFGEGFFDVKEIKVNTGVVPFSITLPDNSQIQVMGTRFNVKAYDKERTMTALVSGTVVVNYKNKRAILKPGQACVKDTTAFQVKKVDTNIVTKWMDAYRCSPCNFRQLLLGIQEKYEVNIYVEPGLENITFALQGNIMGDMPLEVFLKHLESYLLEDEVQFDLKGNLVTVARIRKQKKGNANHSIKDSLNKQ
ncbi:FecR family protein [Paraflavitalea sp. CAU 1676]|uniref:FecR family protein n=1 Tax=Paraflavitalea sp. CAU 1676 TaxID=3032598 RepID=UPI0023DA355D|nr:FecR family protein [Paraflavitalea sp. CAU 1676]MDF2190527.1 FecR family protein [Paraflavitalea sp. CAU 1676]